jgi:hypothetical protein
MAVCIFVSFRFSDPFVRLAFSDVSHAHKVLHQPSTGHLYVSGEGEEGGGTCNI